MSEIRCGPHEMIISNLLDVVQADNPENTVNAAHDGVRGVIGKGKNATE